jgi:hypothetical protein
MYVMLGSYHLKPGLAYRDIARCGPATGPRCGMAAGPRHGGAGGPLRFPAVLR